MLPKPQGSLAYGNVLIHSECFGERNKKLSLKDNKRVEGQWSSSNHVIRHMGACCVLYKKGISRPVTLAKPDVID